MGILSKTDAMSPGHSGNGQNQERQHATASSISAWGRLAASGGLGYILPNARICHTALVKHTRLALGRQITQKFYC